MGKQELLFERVENNIAVNCYTLQYIFEQGKEADRLLALYMFYRYTGAWQGAKWMKPCNRPKATNDYVMKGLGWSKAKIEKFKKKLLKMGLIQNIRKSRDKHYVQVYNVVSLTSTKNVVVDLHENRGANTINNNIINDAAERGFFVGKSKKKKDPYKQIANKLFKILATINRIPQAAKVGVWHNNIRLMVERDGWDCQEMLSVLDWYEKNIRGKYTPKVFSARSFREKYAAIRHAALEEEMFAANDEKPVNSNVALFLVEMGNYHLPEHAAVEFPVAVQQSYDNIRAFRKKWRKVFDKTKLIYEKEMAKELRSSDKTGPFKFAEKVWRKGLAIPLMRLYYHHTLTNLLAWKEWNGHLKSRYLSEGPELSTWITNRCGTDISWKKIEKFMEKYGK